MRSRHTRSTESSPGSEGGNAAPDVLVLGGGGILGEAWMSSVLAGLLDGGAFDARDCGGYLGTSAGSIVAASLVAGIEPGSDPYRMPEQPPIPTSESESEPEPGPTRGGVNEIETGLDSEAPHGLFERTLEAGAGLWGVATGLGSVAGAPSAALALRASAPGGAILRRAALSRVPAGRRSLARLGGMLDQAGVDWDGRLRIAAVELESGRRVIFGASGAPRLSVAAAVKASCAIPGVFRPVRAGGRTYVDGGAWSPTNMDAAEFAEGAHVMCLNPTAAVWPAVGGIAGTVGALSRAIAAAEALAVKHRGAIVTVINPDRVSAAAMGGRLMDPRLREPVIEAGLAQGRVLSR